MERYDEEVALLVGQAGPLDGQRWALRSLVIVGRDFSCDIVVADRQVSRQHAKFTITPNGVLLEDLGSKNGTHRNGTPISDSALLQDGDVIQIALAQQFIFLSSDATVPLEMTADDLQTGSLQPVKVDPTTTNPSGRLRLEPRSRRVWIRTPRKNNSSDVGEEYLEEREVIPPLSVYQFRLLSHLYDNQGRVVPRIELITSVWGEEQAVEVSEQALDALVRHLRDRLANIDPSHEYVATLRGHGLFLDNPPITTMPDL